MKSFDVTYTNQLHEMIAEINDKLTQGWIPVGAIIYDDDMHKFRQSIMRQPQPAELAATVPPVGAANKQSDEIKPCGWRNSCGYVRVNKACKGPTCNIYDPV